MKLRTGRPLSEMVDALERQTLLLQEFCQRAFAEGDLTYLAEIANKLRLLAVRSKNNEPLLFRVMEEHNLDLKIPVGPGPIESAPRISIEQFLAQPAGAVRIPFPDGEFVSYTNGQLIRAWAEQLGGAHEDWRMEDAFRTLLALPAFVGSPERQVTVEVLKIAALVVLDVARRCLFQLGVQSVCRVGPATAVPLGAWPKRPSLFRRLLVMWRRRR